MLPTLRLNGSSGIGTGWSTQCWAYQPIEVLDNVLERDRIDSERAVAPLKQAEDAVVVDNSELTLDEQFNFLVHLARTRMQEGA